MCDPGSDARMVSGSIFAGRAGQQQVKPRVEKGIRQDKIRIKMKYILAVYSQAGQGSSN